MFKNKYYFQTIDVTQNVITDIAIFFIFFIYKYIYL